LNVLLDMNISPALAPALQVGGHQAIHWSSVGDPRAQDPVVLEWARENGFVLITNDLGFGAILAASGNRAPSVLQVRTQDLAPAHLAPVLLAALGQFHAVLEEGALISIDERRTRARILPLSSS
jgi:predicted nuclease of predicted toxin-antitoxin system